MRDVTGPSEPGPGERRLARPPSERYDRDEPAPAPVAEGSVGRALGLGSLLAVGTAIAIVLLGGVAAITAGLLAVAAVGGWVTALAVRSGAGQSLSPRERIVTAVVLALVGIALGQLGLWVYGRYEGGVLGPLDYLAEVFGFLVPVQAGLAALAAWLGAR
jgi:hypothetical protein